MQNLQQVDSLLKDYYDAFRDKNWVVFQDFLTDDFEYYTDGCSIQKKGEFVEFLSRTDWTVHSYSITNVRHIFSEKNDLVVTFPCILPSELCCVQHRQYFQLDSEKQHALRFQPVEDLVHAGTFDSS